MKILKCSKCGYQMGEGEVWVPENTKDNRVFCFTHAPDTAIRLKDTIKAGTVS